MRLFVILSIVCLAACEDAAPPALPVAAPLPRPPSQVTILYTSDEHGWVLPHIDNGRENGGAANILGHWIAHEGHCPGPEPAGAAPEPRPASCTDPGTLLLSGGDNFTGPAITSFFAGEPMAEAMLRMGYAAAAFGNHEFDFGREQFIKNRALSNVLYLGANVRPTNAAASPMTLPKFALFERRGVKVGVVGIGTDTTLTTAMASRFEGIDFLPEEAALDGAIRDAWAAGPDALVAIAHECPDKLLPMLTRHPEWKLSFLGGGHCHKVLEEQVHGTPLISPGWRLGNYVRVRLDIDQKRPAKERVVRVEPKVVEVTRAVGAAGPVDKPLAALAQRWNQKMQQALGEEIGFTSKGMPKDSREITQWVAGSWLEELKVDVAIINTGAIRQALPKGPITKASVWSVLPFDNKLVIVRIKGSDLLTNLAVEEAAAAGVALKGKDYVTPDGKPIAADKVYTVATIDFLYFGGAAFPFKKQDPAPRDTGIDWRTPVIEWTKRLKSSATAPLEKWVGAQGTKKP